ncbi:MAG: hypothetical protein KGD63_08640 [Candidatus Lokiarchaeota archaeon]|nr:hypothetical protein [Candidatus Lokiarchaeota archaeon]
MADLDYKILKIIYRNKRIAKIKEIKNALRLDNYSNIRYSTIDSCIKRLEKEDHVSWKKYRNISLTDKGVNIAKELIRHAQLLEILLFEELGLTAQEAHFESEKFNLLFSCNVINKICEKYKHPEKSPCGEIILDSKICSCIE